MKKKQTKQKLKHYAVHYYDMVSHTDTRHINRLHWYSVVLSAHKFAQ